MAAKKTSGKIWDFLIIFALVYLSSQLITTYFFPPKSEEQVSLQPIVLTMQNVSVRQGNNPVVILQNNSTTTFSIPLRCPHPPVDLLRVQQDAGVEVLLPLDGEAATCDNGNIDVPTQKQAEIDLGPWKQSIFAEPGTYQVQLPASTAIDQPVAVSGAIVQGPPVARFTVVEPGIFVKIFRGFITKPFLNFLILVAYVLPGHNLGIGIILLTLLVKGILFLPTQSALEGQKKMQLLQPKIDALRKEYKDDSMKLNQETMKLWKENHVNPFQSLLPMLIQFPVLIGLFYVIRDSSSLAFSHHLIYPFFRDITWDFNPSFLGFDLRVPSRYIFPPLLILLQFFQMKLSFAIASRKKEKQIAKAEAGTGMATQQKVMTYVLPFMIGFFALQFPAAVSLYWGVSTLFAIGQQMIVNREHLRVTAKGEGIRN